MLDFSFLAPTWFNSLIVFSSKKKKNSHCIVVHMVLLTNTRNKLFWVSMIVASKSLQWIRNNFIYWLEYHMTILPIYRIISRPTLFLVHTIDKISRKKKPSEPYHTFPQSKFYKSTHWSEDTFSLNFDSIYYLIIFY